MEGGGLDLAGLRFFIPIGRIQLLGNALVVEETVGGFPFLEGFKLEDSALEAF